MLMNRQLVLAQVQIFQKFTTNVLYFKSPLAQTGDDYDSLIC